MTKYKIPFHPSACPWSIGGYNNPVSYWVVVVRIIYAISLPSSLPDSLGLPSSLWVTTSSFKSEDYWSLFPTFSTWLVEQAFDLWAPYHSDNCYTLHCHLLSPYPFFSRLPFSFDDSHLFQVFFSMAFSSARTEFMDFWQSTVVWTSPTALVLAKSIRLSQRCWLLGALYVYFTYLLNDVITFICKWRQNLPLTFLVNFDVFFCSWSCSDAVLLSQESELE